MELMKDYININEHTRIGNTFIKKGEKPETNYNTLERKEISWEVERIRREMRGEKRKFYRR